MNALLADSAPRRNWSGIRQVALGTTVLHALVVSAVGCVAVLLLLVA